MVKKAKAGLRVVLAKAADGAPGGNPGTISRANPLKSGSWFITWDAPGLSTPVEDPTPYASSKLKLYTAQAPPGNADELDSDNEIDDEVPDPPEDEDTHVLRKQDFAKLRKSLRGKPVTVISLTSYLTRCRFFFFLAGKSFR